MTTNGVPPELPFSVELLAAAAALRNVRSRLCQLIQEGRWPEGMFEQLRIVQTLGLQVAEALERIATK